jgi:hypothetical protein
MATHYANGKTTTSGLVFMYDTIDKENCYKGEPTINYVPGTYNYSLYAYVSGPVDTVILNEKNQSITAKRYTITNAVNTARAAIFPSGLTTGVSFTFSFKWKYNGTTTASPLVGIDASKGNPEGGANNNSFTSETKNTVSIGNGWYLSTYIFVFSSVPTGNCMLTFGIVTNTTAGYVGETFDIYEAQFEIKNHRTQYSNGTRSATQGLLDLTNTTEIDLSNVSFDANAQMLWDGTDDTMAIADYTTHKPGQPFSYEIVFKPLGGGTSYDKMLIGKPGWHTGIMYQYSYIWFRTRYGSPAFYDTGTVNVIQGNYYHAVATYTSGTSMKLYVNGVLVADNNSIPSALVDIGNTLNIGGSSVNYSSYVEIPAAKMYNRALTQTEITQNYNSYKSRFNLA